MWSRRTAALALLPLGGMPLVPIAAAAAPVMCAGQVATIVGTSGEDTLTGTSGPDVIAGRAGADTINALGGNDLICGGNEFGDAFWDYRGGDLIHGGQGNDVVYGQGGEDSLWGDSGHDTLRGGLDGHRRELNFAERRGDHLVGGPGDDHLDGGRDTWRDDDQAFDVMRDSVSWSDATSGVTVDLNAGRASGRGHDTLTSQPWEVMGSSYTDTLKGSRTADVMSGGAGDDGIAGAGGADELYGGPGDDRLAGGEGNDYLLPELGADHLYGNGGSDKLIVGPESGAVTGYGGPGNDRVFIELNGVAGQAFDGGDGQDTWALGKYGDWDGSRLRIGLASGLTTYGVPTVSATSSRFETVHSWSFFGWPVTVWGTSGADTVVSEGPFTVYGYAGDDTVYRSAGTDFFDGGRGRDRRLGDTPGGADRCLRVEVGAQSCPPPDASLSRPGRGAVEQIRVPRAQ